MHDRQQVRWRGALGRSLGVGVALATLLAPSGCRHRGDDDDDTGSAGSGGSLVASTGGLAPSGGASTIYVGGTGGYGVGGVLPSGGAPSSGGFGPFPVGGADPTGAAGGEGGDFEEGGAGAAGEPPAGGAAGELTVGGAAGEPLVGGTAGEPRVGGTAGEPPVGGAAGAAPGGGAAGEPSRGGTGGELPLAGAGTASGGGSGEASGGGAGAPGCPEITPRSLAACATPGLECTYADCCGSLGTRVVACVAPGKWVIREELSDRCGACPEAMPSAGSPCQAITCDDLDGDNVECMYSVATSSCSYPDLATCRAGSWVITSGCAESL